MLIQQKLSFFIIRWPYLICDSLESTILLRQCVQRRFDMRLFTLRIFLFHTCIHQSNCDFGWHCRKSCWKQNVFPKIFCFVFRDLLLGVSQASIITLNVLQLWVARLKRAGSLAHVPIPRDRRSGVKSIESGEVTFQTLVNHHHFASLLPGVLSHYSHFCVCQMWRIVFWAC